MDWIVEYYRDAGGSEPAKDFMNSLPANTQAKMLRIIRMLRDYGVLLKEPYTRQVRGKIRELRIKDAQGQYQDFILHIYRTAFYSASWFYKENR